VRKPDLPVMKWRGRSALLPDDPEIVLAGLFEFAAALLSAVDGQKIVTRSCGPARSSAAELAAQVSQETLE
jgi:hypothetical protein